MTRRRLLLLFGGLSAVALVFEPFRIAGNFYYVGANDVAAFLIAGPEGHVVLDGGYPTTAPMIMASIAKLGFDIEDVKVLLNSEPHPDHAGGLAALQQASGARLWASEASAVALTSGGNDPDIALPLRAALLDRVHWLPAAARRPPIQRWRHDPCRVNRVDGAHH
jgi:glyoxylase-like metal-dependent hydrolase (beta-lactamase superfamily II)